MDKLKLKWKVFTFLLGFCFLLLGILWMFQTVFLSDMYKFIRKVEINKAIKLVEKNIDSENLEDVLLGLELTKEIMVKPTQEFFPPVGPVPNRHDRKEPESITKAQEFYLDNGSKISLTFYAMVTPVDATVSTLQMQLFILTGIMAMLSTMLAFIISKHISSPIEQISNAAKGLVKGKYQTEFHGKGYLEIKELSDTLNAAASELSKVDQLRRELMANISHDLRTPLALIFSYAEMMHDFPHETTPEQSQIIMDETKRLASLVNDVLDLSNLENGTSNPNKNKYNLTQSLRKTIIRLNKLLENEGYQLEFEHGEDIYLFADEIKITQISYNLMLNAITHSGEDKVVIVRQHIKGNIVRIEVIDHGEGINMNDLPYIWERYYKVNESHKRPRIGTGLGLSIVKNLIEIHGGEYGVESEIGKGSIFWFEIKLK